MVLNIELVTMAKQYMVKCMENGEQFTGVPFLDVNTDEQFQALNLGTRNPPETLQLLGLSFGS